MPVAHTSAAASSSSLIPGSDGTCDDDPTPGSRSGRWVAAAPAAHSASRRVIPKQPSAPAVASASVCGTDSCTRPVRSSREANGPLAFRSSTSCSASSSPMWRTLPSPSRTSMSGVLQRGVRQAGVDVGTVHRHPVPARVGHQRLRRVEAHRLGAQQRRAERRRVMQLEPRRVEHQRREAQRMALRESRNWRRPPASRRSGRPPRR